MELTLSLSLCPVNQDDISAFESRHGLHLPEDFRNFLLKQNGGRPDGDVEFEVPGFTEAVVNDLYGIEKGEFRKKSSIDFVCESLDEDRIPYGFIPIGDDGSGDTILLATPESGCCGVFFFDHENEPYDNEGLSWEEYGNIYKVAESFSGFLKLLKKSPPFMTESSEAKCNFGAESSPKPCREIPGLQAKVTQMSTSYPVKGMTVEQAEAILKTTVQQKVFNGKTGYVVESPDEAITAFCKDGKVYSVRIQHPFSGDVRGAHIGDSEDEIKAVLGEPLRIWKMTSDLEGWFYDDQAFFRIDFSRANGQRVIRIYV